MLYFGRGESNCINRIVKCTNCGFFFSFSVWAVVSMLPTAAICASISQTSNSPFHTLCFQKVVRKTPPRKLKAHLMMSLFDCCSSFVHCRAGGSTCAIGDTWQSVRAKVCYEVTHNYPVVALWTPAQPHTYSTGCTMTLCLLEVTGNDRSDLETEIRHQCKGQL